MTPERWAQIKELFHVAVLQPPEHRRSYLESACDGDGELCAEVLGLLTRHGIESSKGGALRTAELAEAIRHEVACRHTSPTIHPGADVPPDRIGSYSILRILGEGGMGLVYLAEQEKPRRTVALKVIRPGVASPAMLRRFEHEAQVLGRLQHPGIAQIFEAGTANTGRGPQPFFAMEFVAGSSLGEFVQAKEIAIRERLDLFARVCDAVHYAHQKGVIHRDLKPGNILVDDLGQPKILDFGVARAIDSDIHATTIMTAPGVGLGTDIGQLLGTIPYMSPEQAAGDIDDVDARSDVYSLGVVLYELLTDRLPYDLARKMIHEAVRVIREEDPARMSSINKVFRGDIETIVGKALQKERSRRYQAAADFADDIRRYLASVPIKARPPTTRYQIAKFAKLHRAHETAEALAINRFLQDLLASAEPITASGKEVTVRQILEQALQRLESSTVRDQPELESEVRTSIALTYRALGLFDQDELHCRRVLATRQRHFGERYVQTAAAMLNLAQSLRMQTRHAEAEPLCSQSLDIRRELLGDEAVEVAECLCVLAEVLAETGRTAEAEPLLRDAIRINAAVLAEPNLGASYPLAGLAACLIAQGRAAEAEPLLRDCLAIQSALLSEGHWHLVAARGLLGLCLASLDRLDEAEPLLAGAWADLKDDPSVPACRKREAALRLADLHDRRGRPEDAAECRGRAGAVDRPEGDRNANRAW